METGPATACHADLQHHRRADADDSQRPPRVFILKRIVDRIKGYGWLYSSYHSFVSLLEHDPDFNIDLAPKDDQGRPVLQGRWKAVDENRWAELARACLPKEMATIGQNADVTDIAFTGRVAEGGRKLAEYLASTGLLLGTERGNELVVPEDHMFEGLVAPFSIWKHALSRYSHGAPLFNLVYHDAVTNFGKVTVGRFQHEAVVNGERIDF